MLLIRVFSEFALRLHHVHDGMFTFEFLRKSCHCGFGLIGSLLILWKNEEVFGIHTLEREARSDSELWGSACICLKALNCPVPSPPRAECTVVCCVVLRWLHPHPCPICHCVAQNTSGAPSPCVIHPMSSLFPGTQKSFVMNIIV